MSENKKKHIHFLIYRLETTLILVSQS